jgi:DNA repair ATPase RecN
MSSPPPWPWPGARWWLCDLHAHTPASQDVRERETGTASPSPDDLVSRAVAAGADVIAVTDHDSGEWIDRMKTSAVGTSLTVLPGVEITTHERLHVLALGDVGRTTADAHHLLSRLGIAPSEYGMKAARAGAGFPIEKVIAEATEAGWLCVAAHVDAPATSANPSRGALWTALSQTDRGRMKNILDDPRLVAAEIVGEDLDIQSELRGAGRPGRRRLEPGLALVRFSDAHELAAIGSRSTWIKMTHPDREGLALAFSDGDRSVRWHEDGLAPNAPPRRAIQRLTITDLKYAGRGEPLEVSFNPWLNVIIGGRGAGKSTLVYALRIALGRTGEALSEDFARFNQTGRSDSDGALTDATELAVDYWRDGHQIRAIWKNSEGVPALQEPDGDMWTPVDGVVTQRMPARIVGQGELAHLAEDARQLLALVDDSPEVDRRGWQETWDVEQARFLSLRALSREARAAIPDRSALLGERTDVERAIEMLERDEHRKTLRAYQQLQRQIAAIDRWRTSIDDITARLRAALEDTTIDDPPLSLFEDDAYAADVRHALGQQQSELQESLEQIRRAVDSLPQPFAPHLPLTWDSHRSQTESAYQQLADEIARSGADPAQYADLIARRQALDERLAGISDQEESAQRLEAESEDSLRRLAELRDELSGRRKQFIDNIGAPEGIVRFNLRPAGERDANASELRALILGTSEAEGMKHDIEACTTLIAEASDGLAGARAVKEHLRRAAAGAEDTFGGWFRRRLVSAEPEVLDRLDAWFPADRLEAEYQNPDGDWQPISQGSAGQRNAAILAFLLSYGDDPLVLDQPENDLDNALISDLVVRLVREARARRQLIVVTHNPNIVVNADADLVISLRFTGGRITIRELGGLQEQAVREEVCRVVEGGRTAFESRYARIGERHV